MAFKKLKVEQFPPRQWLLIGFPGAGKSSFSTQMRTPILPIDSDHRYSEVARMADGEIFQLSDEPADNINAERIATLLKENMTESGVKTIVIDSLTSIITPLVVGAILENDAGKNKNRVASFKPKSLSLRLLQDTITGWGVDTLWIAHLRTGMDGQAKERESTSISVVELARLRRSLNMQLRVVVEGERRGIYVEWSRGGRSGMTIWDDSGLWKNAPERIEKAVYGGLTVEDMERIEEQEPTTFSGPETAISWGYEQGAFRDAVHAKNSYEKVKAEKQPKTASAMWSAWIENVKAHKADMEEEASRSGEAIQPEQTEPVTA